MNQIPETEQNLLVEEPPPLPYKNHSFLYFLSTQALGAFNDNVFKQLVLLLGVGFITAGIEYQAIVQFLFALPFLLFSGLAGDLSDRISKGRLMVACKIAEVIISLMGVGAFLMILTGDNLIYGIPVHLWLLAVVVFFLGTQSAFFGPAKYGGLPELVRSGDLAPATGLTQMTTFLAIILGVALAGLLADILVGRMYLAGLITVTIAVLGALTSLGIARKTASDPKRKINARSVFSVYTTLKQLAINDPLMIRVICIYSWFWFIGGVALTATNAFGRFQLGLNNFETSLLVACTSLGIAAGSVLVGKLSSGKVRIKLILPAMISLIICLISLSLIPVHEPSIEEIEIFNNLKQIDDLEDFQSIIPKADQLIQVSAFCLFFLLGCASGFYSVPLLTFIQARPPMADKGKVFAAVNWFNWILILAAAIAYGAGMAMFMNQANVILGLLGLASILVAIFLIPGTFRMIDQQKPDFIYIKEK